MTPLAPLAPLGILGGTFDPVHWGHLRLAEEAREQLGLAAVRWIPAGQPAHRHAPQASASHRLDMVRLAIAGNANFQLDDAEVQADTPSYSVPTLQRLREEQGLARPLVLLLGADAFLGLTSWNCWQELFGLAHIAVATRPGNPIDAGRLPAALSREYLARQCDDPARLKSRSAGLILPFSITPLDISATRLREAMALGHSPRYLLPDPVLEHISRHTLYSSSPPP